VEIARAMLGAPQVLIMDEPTSSLTQVDTENLVAAISRLKARGVSIIYISHFLEECQRVADRYTVLRDGQTVGSGGMRTAELPEIIHLMVGRELDEIYRKFVVLADKIKHVQDHHLLELIEHTHGSSRRIPPAHVDARATAAAAVGARSTNFPELPSTPLPLSSEHQPDQEDYLWGV